MASSDSASNRRKLRKGTQSCWECKRRKMRCAFAAPADQACVSCRRRGVACISQELPEEYRPAAAAQGRSRSGRGRGGKNIGDRLSRMEMLMEKLSQKVDSAGEEEGQGELETDNHSRPVPELALPPEDDHRPDHHDQIHPFRSATRSLPEPTSSIRTRPVDPAQTSASASKYDGICRALSAAWPRPQDLDLILKLPTNISGLLHRIVLAPYSSSLPSEPPSPRDVLRLPPAGSHPVLYARKLLTLALVVQAISSDFADALRSGDPSFSCYDIISRATHVANRLVTSNDELIGSCVEGIECLMLESIYYGYDGNLRRAWLTNRRAISMAQVMRLSHPTKLASSWVQILTEETRSRCDPAYMWFLMCHSELYLSLLLGLPPILFVDSIASPATLESCSPLEKLERIHCLAADRILKRNRNGATVNMLSTPEADDLLSNAASSMPPQWWLLPDAAPPGIGGDCSAMNHFHRFIQYVDQITHFYLLAQLHLPSLVHPSTDPQDQYSRIAAMNASRDLLARILAFRRSYSMVPPCRGTYFLSLFSSAVLCIGHMAARFRKHQACAGDGGDVIDAFAHQTPGDRGLMERIVESLEEHGDHANNDFIVSKVAGVIRHLLEVESRAASGAVYSVSSSPAGADEEETVCGGSLSEDGKTLRLRIPYFETVTLQCL